MVNVYARELIFDSELICKRCVETRYSWVEVCNELSQASFKGYANKGLEQSRFMGSWSMIEWP